jgi:hypothetical protein
MDLTGGLELVKPQLILVARVFSAVSAIHIPRDFTRHSALVIKCIVHFYGHMQKPWT